MPPDRLVLNAVLNFAVRARSTGNTSADIIQTGCGFFPEEKINEAKKFIWSEGQMSTRQTDRQKKADTFADILKVLDYCDKNNVQLPKFVIYEPDEVPSIPGEVTATLSRKVNDLCLEFRNFVSAQSYAVPSMSATTEVSINSVSINNGHAHVSTKPSYAVVLKDLPETLDNPIARKGFVDSLCPNSDDISELRKTKQDWKLYVKSKATAEKIMENMRSRTPTVTASLKERLFIGVLKRVPNSMSHTDVETIVPNAVKAVEIGKYEHSKVFKVYFESRKNLDRFLADSVRVGYEKLPAEEFNFLPKRCYSCHGLGHVAADCAASPICGRCGGTDHVSSKDNKCNNDMFCITCKKRGHTCYSVWCPSNRPTPAKK